MLDQFVEWVQNNALFTGLLGAVVGAAATAQYDRRKENANKEEQRLAYLMCFREELLYNNGILEKLKGFIGGPALPGIWEPINALCGHLQNSAWDGLLKEGVLTSLDMEDQRIFRITNRSILDVAVEVSLRVSNWNRILTCEQQGIQNLPSQLASFESFYAQSNHKIDQCIKYALDRIEQALSRMPERE